MTTPPTPPVYLLPGSASIRPASLVDAVLQLSERLHWLEGVVASILGPASPGENFLTEQEANALYATLAQHSALLDRVTTLEAQVATLQSQVAALQGFDTSLDAHTHFMATWRSVGPMVLPSTQPATAPSGASLAGGR